MLFVARVNDARHIAQLFLELPHRNSSHTHFYEPYGQFPRVSLRVFDAVIIVTTFVLEVVPRGKGREFG